MATPTPDLERPARALVSAISAAAPRIRGAGPLASRRSVAA